MGGWVEGLAGWLASSPRSVKPPFWGLYSCVPLMITVWAGRLTPQASVAVQHNTCAPSRASVAMLAVGLGDWRLDVRVGRCRELAVAQRPSHLDVAGAKGTLHQGAVRPQHAGVVDAHPCSHAGGATDGLRAAAPRDAAAPRRPCRCRSAHDRPSAGSRLGGGADPGQKTQGQLRM
jgi:hypothetical protein